MKKYLKKIIAIFLLLEGFYFLYNFALIFTKVINSFAYSDAGMLYTIIVYVATMVLFIFAGIGLLNNKNWALICGWIALLLPQLIKLIVPLTRIPLQNNYTILVINIIALTYLSTQWNKSKIV